MNTQNDRNEYFKRILGLVQGFQAAAPGSLKNHLSHDELVRILIASASTGGGIFGFLQMVLPLMGNLFPDPVDAALAGAVLTVILETRRRLSHGIEFDDRARTRRLAR